MVVVFDLDDTLYKEIDFLKSAYKEIADRIAIPESYDFMLKAYYDGRNAFKEVVEHYHLSYNVENLLNIYRNHYPRIKFNDDVKTTLAVLVKKAILGLISDGRSVQQWNKIKALSLDNYIPKENILISDEFGHKKPDLEGFEFFMSKYPKEEYTYIGDNTSKDFYAPNKLGWTTVCLLDNGENIHKQDFSLGSLYLPKVKVKSLYDYVKNII